MASAAHREVFGRGAVETDSVYHELVDEIIAGSKTRADAVKRYQGVRGERETKATAYFAESFPRLLGRPAGSGDDLGPLRAKLISGELGFDVADAEVRKSYKPISFGEFAKGMQGTRFSDIRRAYVDRFKTEPEGVPGAADAGTEDAAAKERDLAAKRRGRAATILTTPLGVLDAAPLNVPTLLGHGRGKTLLGQ